MPELRPETAEQRPGWLAERVASPPAAIAATLKARKFRFLRQSAIEDQADTIAAAERWIDLVPSLSSAVRGSVEQVFLLQAREEYDVSHSEPCWPSWIFVSVPRAIGLVPSLRLAENVVHEAMHLRLTELEALRPLVADLATRLHSPWKREPRQLQGILHGLYVFVCISAFFRQLLAIQGLTADCRGHMQGRLDCIEKETAAVPLDGLAEGLTDSGRRFLPDILCKGGAHESRACAAG
jgi:HEXXH motif-containing protein